MVDETEPVTVLTSKQLGEVTDLVYRLLQEELVRGRERRGLESARWR